MDTETEVEEFIQRWTQHCIEFIEAGGKGEVGKMISSANRRIIESKVGECCPTCDMNMTPTTKRGRQPKKGESPDPTSITVEHVVSRTLGGNNKLENLVAMCHRCNMYRNATMTKLIPSYAKMHGRELTDDERDKVGRFIEWSIRTIRTPTTKIDPECAELFSNFTSKSKGKTVVSKPSKSKKDRSVSNANEMKQLLEVLQEIRDTQKAILEQLVQAKRPTLRTYIKQIFTRKKGSKESSKSEPKVKSKRKDQPNLKQKNNPKPKPKKAPEEPPIKSTISPEKNTEVEFIIPEKFEQTIRNVLEGKKPMMLAVLGNQLKKYQQENEWEHVGSESFLMMHGFSKKSGLKKAILVKMPDEVVIEGESPRETISLKVPGQTVSEEQPDDAELKLNLDSFRTACIAVIEEQMSPATFALRLGAHASVLCAAEISAKEFAHQCGIAKSWSLLKSLRTHVSDHVIVEGIGTSATIAPLQSA